MSGELMSGGFIGGRLWYHSFIQHTYNNFDTDTETIMKTDIYYKKLIMASSTIQRINKH